MNILEDSDWSKRYIFENRPRSSSATFNGTSTPTFPGADGVSTSTFSFASYLSDSQMMGTDHINMMFAHLSELAERDPATDDYAVIEQLQFMKGVEKSACAKEKDGKSEWWLA